MDLSSDTIFIIYLIGIPVAAFLCGVGFRIFTKLTNDYPLPRDDEVMMFLAMSIIWPLSFCFFSILGTFWLLVKGGMALVDAICDKIDEARNRKTA